MGKVKATLIEHAGPVADISITGKGEAPPIAGAAPVPVVAPAVIVFGRDDKQKAHASWFPEGDAELAIKAAGFMGMKVLRVTTDEHRAAASGLAAGRIFESGKGFVPFAKETAYSALCAFDGAFDPPPPVEPKPVVTPAVTSVPQRHDDIVIGSAVLAAETPDEPWYRAVVIEARGEGLFVLAWQDWPDDPTFVRQVDSLALWPPSLASDHVPLSETALGQPPIAAS